MNTKKIMLSRDGKEKGRIINENSYQCRLEGCRGWRMSVRWDDGKLTYPCSHGTKSIDENTYQII